MQRLASTGATWVAIVVTQYQYAANATSIRPLYDPNEVIDPNGYYTFYTLRDTEILSAIRRAKSLGLKVMLKPHVDLLYSTGGTPGHGATYWRGDIGGCYPKDATNQPFTGKQWSAWFASYEAYFLPYARLAQSEGVEMLSMNCELYCPNRQEAAWRALVAKTRRAYSGLLTTASINGFEEEVHRLAPGCAVHTVDGTLGPAQIRRAPSFVSLHLANLCSPTSGKCVTKDIGAQIGGARAAIARRAKIAR